MHESGWSAPEPVFRRRVRNCFDTTEPAAVAAVVDVRGSAYRRPGAKLLFDGAETTGAITAGCLEGDLAAASRRVADAGTPEVITYDLTSDDEGSWGLGIGCDGIVTVLVEPLSERYKPVVDAFAERKRL